MAVAPANAEIATRFSSGDVPGVRVSTCMPRPSTRRRVVCSTSRTTSWRAQAEQGRFRVTGRAGHHDVVDDPLLHVRVVGHAAVLGHPGVARDADRTAVGVVDPGVEPGEAGRAEQVIDDRGDRLARQSVAPVFGVQVPGQRSPHLVTREQGY